MSAPAYHSPAYEVGDGFTVEFRFAGNRLDCVWGPTLPAPGAAVGLLPAYRAARDRFLSALAPRIGRRVAVMEARAGE